MRRLNGKTAIITGATSGMGGAQLSASLRRALELSFADVAQSLGRNLRSRSEPIDATSLRLTLRKKPL